MLLKIGETIKDIANYSVLLIIVMFTYCLLGLEFFANTLKEDLPYDMNTLNNAELNYDNGVSPRTNFDDIWSSMTTVFILLMSDGWNNIMYDYMRIYNI